MWNLKHYLKFIIILQKVNVLMIFDVTTKVSAKFKIAGNDK